MVPGIGRRACTGRRARALKKCRRGCRRLEILCDRVASFDPLKATITKAGWIVGEGDFASALRGEENQTQDSDRCGGLRPGLFSSSLCRERFPVGRRKGFDWRGLRPPPLRPWDWRGRGSRFPTLSVRRGDRKGWGTEVLAVAQMRAERGGYFPASSTCNLALATASRRRLASAS
jgi:hypothetical protein